MIQEVVELDGVRWRVWDVYSPFPEREGAPDGNPADWALAGRRGWAWGGSR